jgi:hypothetical protein
MLTNNPNISSLAYDPKTKEQISKMSFKDYVAESGASIRPPSGQTISPSGSGVTPSSSGTSGSNIKAIWPGQGAPLQQGMTVGLKGPSGVPVPGAVTQVDQGASGAKVRNPTTGQEEWYNNDDLEPFMAKGPLAANPGQGAVATTEDTELIRLKELAGLNKIGESCSSGATGASAIAVAPTAMNGKKPIKREYTQEAKPVEYTPKEPAKTIIGDTKPSQASGKLSADLAARGKKTASRTNNGFKR